MFLRITLGNVSPVLPIDVLIPVRSSSKSQVCKLVAPRTRVFLRDFPRSTDFRPQGGTGESGFRVARPPGAVRPAIEIVSPAAKTLRLCLTRVELTASNHIKSGERSGARQAYRKETP